MIPSRPLNLFLVRHGAVAGPAALYGRTDVAASAAGRAALIAALQQLHAQVALDAVISSPKQRCAEPAATFARAQQLAFSEAADLRECDFGLWDGVAFDAFDEVFSDAHAHFGWPWLEAFYADPLQVAPPQGETMTAFCTRVSRALVAIAQRAQACGQHNLALVCHGGTVRAAGAATGMARDANWARLAIPYASVHRLSLPSLLQDEDVAALICGTSSAHGMHSLHDTPASHDTPLACAAHLPHDATFCLNWRAAPAD